jgi:cytochrome c-type biogenesis protein CcmH/NrfG
MPSFDLGAGVRMTILVVSLLWIGPVLGQSPFGGPYNAEWSRPPQPPWVVPVTYEVIDSFPAPPQPTPAGPATVSAYALRHPISSKTRRMLTKALHLGEHGNDPAAIQLLLEALAKQASAAPYVDNLLGLEYLKTQQFAEANHVFEEAARLMPDVSEHHSNLGVSLAAIGRLDSAEREARKALDLNPANSRAEKLLALLSLLKEEYRQKALPGGPNSNAHTNALNARPTP